MKWGGNMSIEDKQTKSKTNWIDLIFYIILFVFILYQLYYVRKVPYEPAKHAIIHLGFAMVVSAWARLRSKNLSKARRATIILVIIASVVVTLYFFLNYKMILSNPSFPPFWALVMGVLAAFTSILLVYWTYGLLFPIFSVIAFLYVLYGKYIPGVLKATSSSLPRAITILATDVTSPWGVYGSLLALSANYLFLFIIFGSVLHAFGGLRFIMQLGNLAASKLRSGPAALAVITSALMGSITGSTVANITITGAFTIPLMKKAGYKPSQAAAIEAAASNGGQFLPPIMGATVFVMSSYTGIPYLTIAKAAIIPALIYFVMLLMYAELNARKLNIIKLPLDMNWRNLVLDAPLFIVPLGMLVGMLMKGYSLMNVIFWSIMMVVGLGLISNLRKDAKLDWYEVRDKFAEGAITGSNVAIILAVIGITVAAIEVTGLTLKLSIFFAALAGNNLLLLLFFTMLTSLILGTAVPTPAAYVIVATVLSPLLIRLGLPTLQAHLFPMFFAFLSHLTPPVGIGLIVACKMSDSSYRDGAIEVWKAAFPSLFLPFVFVYSPAILLQYDNVATLIFTIIGVSLGFFVLAVIFNGAWKLRLLLVEKIVLAISALAAFNYVFTASGPFYVGVSLVLCIAALSYNMKRTAMPKNA